MLMMTLGMPTISNFVKIFSASLFSIFSAVISYRKHISLVCQRFCIWPNDTVPLRTWMDHNWMWITLKTFDSWHTRVDESECIRCGAVWRIWKVKMATTKNRNPFHKLRHSSDVMVRRTVVRSIFGYEFCSLYTPFEVDRGCRFFVVERNPSVAFRRHRNHKIYALMFGNAGQIRSRQKKRN